MQTYNVYVCIIKLPAVLQCCTIITVNKILYILLYYMIIYYNNIRIS